MSRYKEQPRSSRVPDAARAATLAEILKSVAHPLRLRIVAMLCEGSATVSELQAALRAPQAIVSQQLRILRLNRLVAVERRGGHPQYRLLEEQLRQLVACANRCGVAVTHGSRRARSSMSVPGSANAVSASANAVSAGAGQGRSRGAGTPAGDQAGSGGRR